MSIGEKTAPKPVLNIKFPPFLYYIGCLFIGTFLGAFLTYQVTKDNYTLNECFLVHEAVEKEPEVLGGSSITNTSESENVKPQSETQTQNQNKVQKEEVTAEASKSNLVSINNATLAELDTLPGIGPAYGQRIIEGRPYRSLEEILNVKGIGPKTFEKIRALVSL